MSPPVQKWNICKNLIFNNLEYDSVPPSRDLQGPAMRLLFLPFVP